MLKLVRTLNVGGVDREINCDFETGIAIMQQLERTDLSDIEKAYVARGILFVDPIPPAQWAEADDRAAWFLDGGWGLSESVGSPTGRLYSWSQDLRFIIQATDKVLGYSSRATEDLHWWTFLGAFSEIDESVFGMLVHQRRLRQTGKQSREDKEWWSDNIGIAKLKTCESDEDRGKKQEFEELLKGTR